MNGKTGQRLGDRYELMEPAGGAHGTWTSWLAQDTKFGERVQLRVFAAGTPDDRARAAWAARLTHRLARTRGVVRVLDWGEEHGLLYQALDVVANAQPLDLAQGSLAERIARLAPAVELVADMHRQGVAHLDLVPARFLVSAEGVHLTGFEAARCASEANPPPLPPPLDPTLAAPERLRPDASLGPPADVFSLGAMLHVVLFRRPPGERLPSPPPIDPAHRPLVDLARATTAQDPAKRPPVHDLLAALRRPTQTAKRPARSLPALPEGFSGWEELRKVADAFSPEAVAEAWGQAPVLVIRRERPLNGKTTFLGRCAPVRGKGGPTAPITLGRAADADLRLELPTVSSKHLTFARGDGGAWTVTDTSSNGTSVEGAPLRRGATRPLADRETICLSDHVWVQFLLPQSLRALLSPEAEALDFAVEDAGRAQSAAQADPLGVSSFIGRIVGTELVEFLQLVELNQRSGTLIVHSGKEQATVSIREGKVVEAALGTLTGAAAVKRALTVKSGTFAFTAGPVEPGSTSLPISHLLLDALRQSDERQRPAL